MLMRDVWNYLKDNVPGPHLYKRDAAKGEIAWREKLPDDSPYSETLRLIMQSHLETLGGLYAQVFVKPQLGDDFSKSCAKM
jgi:Integrator complex subunit 5 C-terminus